MKRRVIASLTQAKSITTYSRPTLLSPLSSNFGHSRSPTAAADEDDDSRYDPTVLSKVKQERLYPVTGAKETDRIYNLAVKTPLSAYAALSQRIDGLSAMDIQVIEQCCVCPSFWKAIQRERITLSNASSPRPDNHWVVQGSNVSFTNFLDAKKLSNEQWAILGNELLGLFALEWLEQRYPFLPTKVVQAALTMYVGTQTCSDVARSWGVSAGVAASHSGAIVPRPSKSASGKPVPGKSTRGVGEGMRSGTGTLRFDRSEATVKKAKASDISFDGKSFTEAMANVSRAFVGAIYTLQGFESARNFVHAHWLTRKANFLPLLKWEHPKLVLNMTLRKHALGELTTRLISETGRLTHSPVFVVGAYSTNDTSSQYRKIGEGFGSSLKMAEYRACEDALRRFYLSQTLAPFDANTASGAITLDAAEATVGLPSDTLCADGREYKGSAALLGDSEVQLESR